MSLGGNEGGSRGGERGGGRVGGRQIGRQVVVHVQRRAGLQDAEQRPDREPKPGDVEAAGQGRRDPRDRPHQSAAGDKQDRPRFETRPRPAPGGSASTGPQRQAAQGSRQLAAEKIADLVGHQGSGKNGKDRPGRPGLVSQIARHQKKDFAKYEQARPRQGIQKSAGVQRRLMKPASRKGTKSELAARRPATMMTMAASPSRIFEVACDRSIDGTGKGCRELGKTDRGQRNPQWIASC